MAEIEEIIEGVEEGLDAAEEGIADLSEEVQEEIMAEVAEAREEISIFSRAAEALKDLLLNIPLKKLAMFLIKNSAIGVILWGVNTLLTEMYARHKSEDIQKKRCAVKALTSLIKTETEMVKTTVEWMKEHKDDTIVLDGIEVPLESVMTKYINPLSEVCQHHCTLSNTSHILSPFNQW